MIIFKILYSHISGSLVGIAYTCDERTFVSFKTAHKAVSGWKYLPSSINNQDKITRSIGEVLLLIYISGREELWDFDEREAVFHYTGFFFFLNMIFAFSGMSMRAFPFVRYCPPELRCYLCTLYFCLCTLWCDIELCSIRFQLFPNTILLYFLHTCWVYFKSLPVLSHYKEDENGIVFNL